MIIAVDTRSAVPPYEQIRTQVAAHVAEGTLVPGSRLPTVRQLAKDLGLAVNTVARAYRELEHTGVVVSRGRHGTFVNDTASTADDRARTAARTFIDAARTLGLHRTDAIHLVERLWPQTPAPNPHPSAPETGP